MDRCYVSASVLDVGCGSVLDVAFVFYLASCFLHVLIVALNISVCVCVCV